MLEELAGSKPAVRATSSAALGVVLRQAEPCAVDAIVTDRPTPAATVPVAGEIDERVQPLTRPRRFMDWPEAAPEVARG